MVVRCARQAVRGNSVVCEDVLGEACTAVEEKLHTTFDPPTFERQILYVD